MAIDHVALFRSGDEIWSDDFENGVSADWDQVSQRAVQVDGLLAINDLSRDAGNRIMALGENDDWDAVDNVVVGFSVVNAAAHVSFGSFAVDSKFLDVTINGLTNKASIAFRCCGENPRTRLASSQDVDVVNYASYVLELQTSDSRIPIYLHTHVYGHHTIEAATWSGIVAEGESLLLHAERDLLQINTTATTRVSTTLASPISEARLWKPAATGLRIGICEPVQNRVRVARTAKVAGQLSWNFNVNSDVLFGDAVGHGDGAGSTTVLRRRP